MRRHPVALAVALATLAGGTLAVLSLAHAQQVHRNGFEARTPAWTRGTADAVYHETVHDVTDQTAHSGQFSEHLQLTAEVGSFIYYSYPTGRAPIAEELSASLWLKANRPGAQLLARVVLPHERNPTNLDEPLTTLVRGDAYQLAGRWQRLELRRVVKLAREQQQLMRAELKRDVNFTDAFIDQLVLNVYGGPGQTEVWIDDLEVGPVQENAPFQTTSRPSGVTDPRLPDSARPRPSSRASVVTVNQDHLLVGGKRFFFRGIRHSNTPLKALRDAGFNTVWFDYATPPALMAEAVNLGFWLVPAVPVATNDSHTVSADLVGQVVTRFLDGDAVLFWDLGSGLAFEQSAQVEQAARMVHAADAQRPLGGDVWDGFKPYSRNLDLMGIHRWPLMTGLELTQYQVWLDQRRRLARPGTFTWTWVQTHLPDWYTNLVYNKPSSSDFAEPIGPQPEQIRLLTYSALAAGCRGLGFWSDRFLADSHQGRDRLLTLALLNQEMQLLEPMLVSIVDTPAWVPTSLPDVIAAVLHTERGVLVLPMWLGKGAQFVPGQSASNKLTITVPLVPNGTQAWEVTPGGVRSLPTDRVLGGTKVTVPEFGLTTAIVFTSDNSPNGLLVRFQDQARRMRKLAAQWTHDLAEVEIEKVMKVEAELERAGHTLPDGKALADDARARLRACVEQWNNGDYRQAYEEGQRALRPLRIMMRAQWDQAVRRLDTPVASPYAVSFFTLPQHWQFLAQLSHTTTGTNVLPDGDFEVSPDRPPTAWTAQETTQDDVELIARRVMEKPKEGRQCLMLRIKPRGAVDANAVSRTAGGANDPNAPPSVDGTGRPVPQAPPSVDGTGRPIPPAQPGTPGKPPAEPPPLPAALERTFLAINSPMVKLPPGMLVRISAWVRIPSAIGASVDGALLYDSVGGEPLAVRLVEASDWKKYTLYRRVPASGTIGVTLALTGLGAVYFDDVRIEPLLPNTDTAQRPEGP